MPSEELDRYRRQYNLVCGVCSEYEAETSNDSDEVKKKRFEKLLSLMQQVHVILKLLKMIAYSVSPLCAVVRKCFITCDEAFFLYFGETYLPGHMLRSYDA